MRIGVVGTGRIGRAIADLPMAELALGIYEEASCWPGRGRP
jgi:hypothetical protein